MKNNLGTILYDDELKAKENQETGNLWTLPNFRKEKQMSSQE